MKQFDKLKQPPNSRTNLYYKTCLTFVLLYETPWKEIRVKSISLTCANWYWSCHCYLGYKTSPRLPQSARSFGKTDNVETVTARKDRNDTNWVTGHESSRFSLWPLLLTSQVTVFCHREIKQRPGWYCLKEGGVFTRVREV